MRVRAVRRGIRNNAYRGTMGRAVDPRQRSRPMIATVYPVLVLAALAFFAATLIALSVEDWQKS